MGNIVMYVQGDNTDANFLLAELNRIAEKHGYLATRGPTTGEGAFSRLAVAIADHRVIVLKVVPGMAAGLRAFLTEYPDQEWARELLDQLAKS